MRDTLNKMEQSVERDMALLRRFVHPAPDTQRIDEIAAAMFRASRTGGSLRSMPHANAVARWAIAASLLLAFGLSWSTRPVRTFVSRPDPSESLAAWKDAVDQSTTTVTQLFTAVESLNTTESDAQHGIDDFSEAFDSTFGTGA